MTEQIVNKMARTLFVSTYADAIDNDEIQGDAAGPGQDWMDVAPATPDRFQNEAWRLVGRIEQLNGMGLICLFAAACEADKESFEAMITRYHADALTEADWHYIGEFGHCLAMQSMGHGVSWFDDHEHFELKLPLIEVSIEPGDLTTTPQPIS